MSSFYIPGVLYFIFCCQGGKSADGSEGRNVKVERKSIRGERTGVGKKKARVTETERVKIKKESAQGTMAQKSTQTKTAVETVKQGQS